ncbi:MAG TPA: hypothetical protein VFO07_18845, partial [Roseiflexaceae bacterium]|nr:hypothetical protein [Roseiflexaceae bacterium]
VAGIAEDDFTRVVREDPARRGTLYCGTETGVYASFDDGARWRRVGGNLPVVPIHDMVVAQGDLVLATHGRSFWVLDDLSLLRQLGDLPEQTEAALLAPRDAVRLGRMFDFGPTPQTGRNYTFVAGLIPAFDQVKTPDGEIKRTWLDAGTNPPDGVVVSYVLPEAAEGDLALTFRDASGAELRTFKSKKKDKEPEPAATSATGGESAVAPGESAPTPSAVPPETAVDKQDEDEPKAPAKAGLNRFVWDMRGAPAQKIASGEGHKDVDLAAPRLPPGRYRVELVVGGRTLSAEFGVVADPRASTTQAEYEAQYALLRRVHGLLDRAHGAVNRVRAVRKQVDAWIKRSEKYAAGAQIAEAGKQLNARLAAAEEHLIQVKAKSSQDTLNFPTMLNAKLSFLAALAGGSESGPTRAQEQLCEDLAARVEEQIGAVDAALAEDLPAFNALVRDTDVPAVVVPEGK